MKRAFAALTVLAVALGACGSSKSDTTEQRTRRAAELEQRFRAREFPTTVISRERTLVVRELEIAGEDFCRENTIALWLAWSADPQNVKAIVPPLDQAQLVADGFVRIECVARDGQVWGLAVPYDVAKAPVPRTNQVERTEVLVKKLAFEAYPQWAASNPTLACPPTIRDLFEYISSATALDAWGHPLQMACGDKLPAGAKGLAIHSLGPDGVDGTADDIKSW